MFMGHLGTRSAQKGAREHISLPSLCLVAIGPNLVDFSLERSGHSQGAGLWTHSLASMLCYAVILFTGYSVITQRYEAALLLGLIAGSHVLADLITSHRVLWPGGPRSACTFYLHAWRARRCFKTLHRQASSPKITREQ